MNIKPKNIRTDLNIAERMARKEGAVGEFVHVVKKQD